MRNGIKKVFALMLAVLLMLGAMPQKTASALAGPATSVTVNGKAVTVSWQKVALATSYEMEIYTAANYQKMLNENGKYQRYSQKLYGLTGTSRTVTLGAGSWVITVAAVNRTSWAFGNACKFTVSDQKTLWLHGIPVFRQYDSRWASTKISTKTIGQVGCTLTCLAMSESYRQRKIITPADMRKQLSFSGNDLYWPSRYYTMGSRLDLKAVYQMINAGKPVIIGAQKVNGGWHWVIVTGYVNLNPNQMKAACFQINDPNSSARTNLAQFLAVYPNVGAMKTYR